MLQLCGLAEVLLIDEQAIYSPSDYNDRLLLGLKGTMSEAEQYWMRLRLEGGRLSQGAARRALHETAGRLRVGQRHAALPLRSRRSRAAGGSAVFERFRLDGAAYSVSRYFVRHGLLLPTREGQGELRWHTPSASLVLNMLHNPVYAGAYVFGRSEERLRLVDGHVRRRQLKKLPQEA